MDSVTSGGSLQSSSGGEADDFTTTFSATADSLSAFFHDSSGAAAAAVPLPPSADHPYGRRFFDPISYLDSISSISPSPSWPPPPLPPPSPPRRAAAPLSTRQPAATASVSSMPVQPPDPVAPPTGDAPPRSSKKRSRASRRAQTTVLTTDTSNFRAMVQQFTGIPSLPFDLAGAGASSSPPLGRSTFGLLRSSSPSSFLLQPPLLLRPFPLKTSTGAPAPPAAAYSSSAPPGASAGIAAANSALNGGRSNASTQNPMLTLQSLLHDMPAFVRTTKSTAETPGGLGSSDLWSPAGPELLVSGDARPSWRANGSSQSRPEICSTTSQQGASSCKMNYFACASSPEFDAEKEASEPAPAAAPPSASKGEDIVDSWIFSSD